MRMCFFKPNSLFSGGGAEKWMINVSRALSKHHKVSIVGLNYPETKRLCSNELVSLLNHVEYHEFPSVKLPRGDALPNPIYFDCILSLFNSSDLVYVMVPSTLIDTLIYLIRHCIRSKLIAGFHGFLRSDVLLQKLYLPIFKKSLGAFNAYHALNSATYIWLQKMGFSNVFLIPNGVDTRTFQLCENPSSYQIFNILFSGRLTEDKGADILIKIIQYINERLKARSIKFTIAGSGPLEDRVKAVTQKYKNVNFLGFVGEQVLPNIYMGANLFLIPSRTEGMPLSLLEAQSCGLPAIGSNIPGISDIIINGKTGRLIHPGNIASFAEAIKEYYLLWRHSPEQYYEMCRTIREHIVNNYDWNSIIGKIENMFKETLTNTM